MNLFHFSSPGQQLEQNLPLLEQTPGALLLDVRSPQEYASGHLPGAVNLPLNQLAAIDVPKDRPIFAYCHSGARSARACAFLGRMGYQAVNLGGLAGYSGNLE